MIRAATESFNASIELLNTEQSIKGVKLFALSIINVFIDLLSLASIFPLIFVLLSPKTFEESSIAQTLYNYFGFETPQAFLRFAVIIVFLLFSGKTLFSYLVIKWKADFTHGVAGEITKRLYTKLLSPNNFLEYEDTSGSMINKMINVPTLFVSKIIGSYMDLLINLMIGVFILCFLVFYERDIFVYLMIILLPIVLIYFRYQNQTLNSTKNDIKEQRPLLIQRIFESKMGQLDILLSGAFVFFQGKMNHANNKYQDAIKRHNTIINSTPKNIELIAVAGICLLFFSFTFVENQKQALFILSVYMLSAYRLIPAISRVAIAFADIKVHKFTIEEINDFLSNEEGEQKAEQSLKPLAFSKRLTIKDLCFEYPNSPFLIKSFTADFNKNEKIALIGPSGSGKTTLIKLILGTLESSSGSIMVDDVIINKTNLKPWRENIAYVSQDPFLFEATLFDNIAMGQSYSKDNINRVQDILKLLELSEYVNDSELGLKRNLGENGSNLSGGQKQRVAIARALFQDKSFLIFDEVTSNLDEENRKKVLQSIVKVAALDKTILFVTHQTDIINLCGKIIDLENQIFQSSDS